MTPEQNAVAKELLIMTVDPKCPKCAGLGIVMNQWGSRVLCSCVRLKGQDKCNVNT